MVDSTFPVLDSFAEGEPVTLTNCDREPIHHPGLIQPHGVLLVLTDPDFIVDQVSQNTREILGVEPANLIGYPLAAFAMPAYIEAIRECLDRSFEQTNPLPFIFTYWNSAKTFDSVVHQAQTGEIILELEPCCDRAQINFFEFHRQVRGTLASIQKTQNLKELCQLITQKVRQTTGFDRVMVYQFNAQGDGTVVAEDKRPDLESFLDLRYPDSDIPKQAKVLYSLNYLRLIPTVDYEPVSLVSQKSFTDPSTDPSTTPELTYLDMSYCSLRSVSPIHIEYLKNMGVAASMSISLMHQGTLWGLVACHHMTPKFVAYNTRMTCEFLGQLMSVEISNKVATDDLDYKLQLKAIQQQFIDQLTGSTDLVEALTQDPELLLKVTNATGVIICVGDHCTAVGRVPPSDFVRGLLVWLKGQIEHDQFVTQALPKVYPLAEEYKDLAAGCLAVAISKIQNRYVIWFRPELPQTVTWAGNPEKPKRLEADGTLTIFPRQSFEAWQEIVRGQSNPWRPCELEGATELRQAIVDIVIRQADELALLNLELERSNKDLDAFAYIASHDLKEPLRGIHNYASFLLEDYSHILEVDGVEKLNTLVTLTQRMEALIESLLRFSRLDRQDIRMDPINLHELLQDISGMFQMNPRWADCSIQIPKSLPTIYGNRSLLEEVFTNLISNAFKYNTCEQKCVEIGCDGSKGSSPGRVTLYVKDNGIGIREKHFEAIFRIFKRLHPPSRYGGGTGAGLTIVKKIVERHSGTIWLESAYGQGTTFFLTLPS